VASCSMETWNFLPWDRAVFVRLLLKATPLRMVSSLCFSKLIWSSSQPAALHRAKANRKARRQVSHGPHRQATGHGAGKMRRAPSRGR